MKKSLKLHRVLVVLLTVLIVFVGFRYYDVIKKEINNKEPKEVSPVVLSLEDNYDKNDYWIGTFNLLWNNIDDDLSLENVSGTNSANEKIIANLNKKTFTKKNISGEAYYNKHGYATMELKKTILKDIKKNFDTNSKVLDNIEWNDTNYLFYSMLYKEFKFKYKFEELEKEKFKNTDNVEYFGIKDNNSKSRRGQVEVLYYQDINNFAVKLLTNSSDEVILTRGGTGDNFLSVYENMQKLASSYDGNKKFGEEDQLKVPVIDFNNHEVINNLNGVTLKTKNDNLVIKDIIRDTTFKLDKTGGKIKDEVAMETFGSSLDKKSRLFYLTSDFDLFLKEKNKDLPYFAMNVSDITQFQKIS